MASAARASNTGLIKAKSEFLKPKVRVDGLLTAAGILACAATLAGIAGKFHWLLDLCSHFPLHCAVFLLIAGASLAFLRKWVASMIFVLFAAWNFFVIWPHLIPNRRIPERKTGVELKALLVNVRTENTNFAKVRELVRAAKPDIVVVEEVSAEWLSQLEPLRADFAHVIAEPREDNFGIALFSRLPLRECTPSSLTPLVRKGVTWFGGSEVPSIVAYVQTSRGQVLMIATHPLPPVGGANFAWRNEQLQRVAGHVNSERTPTIVLGDLNTSPWSYHFRRFIRESGLVDSSRGKGWQPTWPTMLPLLGVPIDHALCSEGLTVIKHERGPHIGSDHYPLIVTFAL